MARKRPNGDGTIVRRKDGRYEAKYYVEDGDGNWRRRSIYGRRKSDVREKLDKAKAERDLGIVVDDRTQTVGEFFDEWLESCVRGYVAESTYSRDAYLVRKHIKPSLGKRRLRDLKATHIQNLYSQKRSSGLSGGTRRKIHQVIHKALKQAERLDMISRNPATLVTAPREDPKEITPLSRDDVRRFLEAASKDRFEALYYLAAFAGMRQGELLALKWGDVDLNAGYISVRRSLTRTENGNKSVVGKTKSKASNRRIGLIDIVRQKLLEHRNLQAGEKVRAGSLYNDEGFVFAGELGNFINSSNLRNRSFKPLLKRSGVPEITFHGLRHTFASLLFQRNFHVKNVQGFLGHTKVALTLDTYSHVIPGMEEEQMEAMERALGDILG